MANISFAKNNKTNNYIEKENYKILLVDDDNSIHKITTLAIEGMQFQEFELQIFSAYNVDEAKKILNEHNDIALALIDVVMETPEAGLELVNYIRNTIENKLIRLIIRTGQANDFPQMKVIQEYDINDFKEKTELTIERLYTTIRSSVKQYEQLIQLQKKYEETYQQLITNSLTKLPNRIKLVEDFTNQSNKTLILIDIIRFSSINDTNGYEVGDYVLKELGGFLSSMYSSNFNVYHLNNDLFALVTKESNVDNLVDIIEQIKEDISKLEIVTDNFHKTLETTLGVAYQTEENVIRKAELALQEARNSGKNQIKYYSDDLKIIKQINETNHWAPILNKALKNNLFVAYAQPIYSTNDLTIEKYELLVRLNYDNVIYTPYQFLEAAEHTGNMYNIFKFMFNEGCRLASKTGKLFSINISDCEFQQVDLVEYIKTTLQKHNTDPKLISLEILEYSAITHSQTIKEIVMEIHSLGIEFIIDDFGVQCSNFAQSEHLPISTLKIDGSFIKDINQSIDSEIITKTIKTYAKEKGLKIIAEFVCNKEVYDKVKELEIDCVQGYYLSEPQDVNKLFI